MFSPFKDFVWTEGITKVSNTIKDFKEAKVENKEEAVKNVIEALHNLHQHKLGIFNFILGGPEDSLHMCFLIIRNIVRLILFEFT
ncbi:MAG: hypothetical protein ACTSQE_13515 [Candidatus Heimdallarchaeaceae archaeon]